MRGDFIVLTHAVSSVFFFIIAGMGATFAVFSSKIKDSLFERIGLVMVTLTTWGTAARVIKNGWISEGGLALSFSLAFYVIAIICKKWKSNKPTQQGPGDSQ